MPDGALPPVAFDTVEGPAHWQCVDIVSDVHLNADEPATAAAFAGYLTQTRADALFILGDLFEVWIGDDDLAGHAGGGLADCLRALRHLASRCVVHVLHGNRDFLLGAAFAQAMGVRLLPDPAVLNWCGRRTVLSHGDLLCVDDHDYQAFRVQVRTAAWQQAFLALPLEQRREQARAMRAASRQRQATASHGVDADAALSCHWLEAARSGLLIHGHTHRPARHELGAGRRRIVLSDWDALAQPPRLQVLRCHAGDTGFDGWQRLDLPAGNA